MSEMTRILSYVAVGLGGAIVGMAIEWLIERISEHDEVAARECGEEPKRNLPIRG